MGYGNTAKDGSGVAYWQLCDAYGRTIVVGPTHTVLQITASGNIKATAGILHGLLVGYKGVTAGDTVVVKDGSGGTTLFTVPLPAANGTLFFDFHGAPINFATAIYALITITGGNAYVTGIYD